MSKKKAKQNVWSIPQDAPGCIVIKVYNTTELFNLLEGRVSIRYFPYEIFKKL